MTTITLPRATVEQALECLKGVARGKYDGNAAEVCAALEAALAQQAEAETCTWQQDGDSDSGVYGASCGGYFSLDDGTPEDNKMAWCCYCGKRLVQELITEDEDE